MSEPRDHPRRIGLALGASIVASGGLVAIYVLGGQPQVEGALLLVALGGLAVALVLWGKHLMPQGPFVEEREPMSGEGGEREAPIRDFEEEAGTLRRRTFLRRMLYGALAALAAVLLFPIRSLGPRPGRALFQTPWRAGSRLSTKEGTLVRVDDVPVGGVLTVFPEGNTDAIDATTILIRLDPDTYEPLPGREDWSPEGYLAYSKLCTHAGCPVGLFEPPTQKFFGQPDTNKLFCPCHQSVFDVPKGARPIAGPAVRPLPQLPLEVDARGFLVAQDDYDEPTGPDFWNAGREPEED